MSARRRRRRKGRRSRRYGRRLLLAAVSVLVVAGLGVLGYLGVKKILPAAGDKPAEPRTPGELLVYYMAGIETESYEAMYGMLDEQSRGAISPEAFVERNRNIYEGIEASGVQVEITETQESGSQAVTVFYETRMDTAAGEISFSNKAVFLKNKDIRMCLFGMTV